MALEYEQLRLQLHYTLNSYIKSALNVILVLFVEKLVKLMQQDSFNSKMSWDDVKWQIKITQSFHRCSYWTHKSVIYHT